MGGTLVDTVWDAVKSGLKSEIGVDAYRNWIAPLTFVEDAQNTLHFCAPIAFIGRYVERTYGNHILSAFRDRGVEARNLVFTVSRDTPAPPPATVTATATAPSRQPEPRHAERDTAEEMPGAPLDPRFTFEAFVVGKPNELAVAAARRVADGGPVGFNPLFLYGGVGLGKTHLMHAIAWGIRERRPDYRVLYLTAEQFMYRFVQALRGRSTMQFKEMFRSVDVLMVDDVQFIAGKDSTQDEFFHTFNALIEQQKQIIISADRSPGELSGLEERISSRLGWGLVVDLHPTDYELRLSILQSKVEAHEKTHGSLRIQKGVLEFLAHRISTNVRVLEGALTRLIAVGTLIGKEIDLELTQECLSDVLRASQRKVTVDEIIRKVSQHYNVRIADIMGQRRTRTIARPRQVAMYLCKTLTTKSYPDIGRAFGGKDHTTVIHAFKRIEDLRQNDSQIADDIEMLRRMLEA